MSIEAWANASRRGKYHQGVEHQRAIDTIQSLLEGEIDSDSAARTIAQLYEPLLKRRTDGSPVAILWSFICDAARVLDGNRGISDCLVDLVNSISKLPNIVDEHGKAITPSWSSAGEYWSDLPELAMMFREYGIDIEPDDYMETEGDRDSRVVFLLNATTFGAIYLARGRQPIGMWWHAEVGLMQGIEVPYETLEQHQRAALYVPPAATWMLLAGRSIYELCKVDHGRLDGGPGSTPDGDEWLWGYGRGYSLGRWSF